MLGEEMKEAKENRGIEGKVWHNSPSNSISPYLEAVLELESIKALFFPSFFIPFHSNSIHQLVLNPYQRGILYLRFSGEPGSQQSFLGLDSSTYSFCRFNPSLDLSHCQRFTRFLWTCLPSPCTNSTNNNRESSKQCIEWYVVVDYVRLNFNSCSVFDEPPPISGLQHPVPGPSLQPLSWYPTTIRTKGYGLHRTRQAIHPPGDRSQTRFSVREGSWIRRSLVLPIDDPQTHWCGHRRMFSPSFIFPRLGTAVSVVPLSNAHWSLPDCSSKSLCALRYRKSRYCRTSQWPRRSPQMPWRLTVICRRRILSRLRTSRDCSWGSSRRRKIPKKSSWPW